MSKSPRKRSAANDQPGSEAMEPSPGEAAPTKENLEPVDKMYRNAAKKLARERATENPKKPADD